MKKLYKTISVALFLALGLSATAQQLPNVGFESWKSACGSTEAFGTGGMTSSKTGEMRQRPGVEPSDWNGSNINQKVIMQKQEDGLVTKGTDANGGSCAQLTNVFVGVGSIGSTAPGYLTLGTPWVYAVSDISSCDGGTYGGVAFTYKPDAITGQFKRTDSNNSENSVILAYLWNGTFKSKVGAKGAPTQERENCDRAILGKNDATADPVTGDGKLVASCEHNFTTTNGEWQTITLPLNYVDGASEPTMMNVVVCGGNYNDRSALINGTTLLADDVKFLYYSRLSDLKIAGTTVNGFNSDTYTYDMSGSNLPAESDIEVAHMGIGARHTISIDNTLATVTITVTNDGNDIDGVAEHTYVLQYERAANVSEYPGYLNITMMGGSVAENSPATIYITDNGDGTCNFLLPNLTLPDLGTIGDIELNNVTMTAGADGSTVYSGKQEGMLLLDGAITADVTLNGTISASGEVKMTIDVLWIQDPNDRTQDIPLVVTFTTNQTTGVEDMEIAPAEELPVNVYTITGVKVLENVLPSEAAKMLDRGFYIMGNKKIIVK